MQSAFSIPTTEKRLQEERPLRNVGDGFRKVIVTKDNVVRHHDENGVLIMGLQEFLLDARSIEKEYEMEKVFDSDLPEWTVCSPKIIPNTIFWRELRYQSRILNRDCCRNK